MGAFLLLVFASSGFAGQVHGFVQNADGQPVAAVWVGAGFGASQALTDSNGAYALDLPPGIFFLELSLPFGWNYEAPRPVQVSGCEDQEVDFVLQKYEFTRRITGRVVSGLTGTGQAATVAASRTIGSATVQVSTNTDAFGQFQLPAFPGEWTVAIDLGSGVSELSPVIRIRVSEATDAMVLIPTHAGLREVKGLLLDANSNAMPNIPIWCRNSDEIGDYEVVVWTDGEGKFLARLFDAEWLCEAYLSYPYRESLIQRFTVSDSQTNVFLQAPPLLEPLIAETTWGGHVADENGAPLTNVTVASALGVKTNSDDNGDFLMVLPEGSQSVTIESLTNYIGPVLHISPAEDFSETAATLVARRATTHLHVQVQSTNAGPLVGATITASTLVGGLTYSVGGTTDCSGAAEIEAFPGTWLFRVEDSTGRTNLVSRPGTRLVALPGGETNLIWYVSQQEKNVAIQGRVLDELGNPANARVVVSSATSFELVDATAEGAYSTMLAPERISLSVLATLPDEIIPGLQPDFSRDQISTNLDLIVRHGTNAVTVNISNFPAGTFLAVSAATSLNGTNYSASPQRVAPHSFALALFNGDWEIRASYFNFDNASPETKTNIVVHGSSQVVNLSLPPPPERSALITGRVVDEEDAPVPFVGVGGFAVADGTSEQTVTRSDGTFSLPLAPGQFDLSATDPFFPSSVRIPVRLEAGSATNVTLVLPRILLPLECIVQDPASNAIYASTYANCNAGETNLFASGLLLENGHSLLLVPPGQCTVSVNEWSLNSQGFQSTSSVFLDVSNAMDCAFTAVPITPNGRVPKLVIRLEDSTNLVVNIESEVAAHYAVEESSDLVSWNRVTTAYTLNRSATCLLPLAGTETHRFYRAIWLSY